MRIERTGIAGGFILADAALAPVSAWFEAAYWKRRGAGEALGRGRGVAVSAGESGRWVLRHYRRGGWPSRFVADTYAWRGEKRARPVRELHVLAVLSERGAPVPRPVAVRVLRRGFVSRGDILTERITGARTLATCADTLKVDVWRAVGKAIHCFHAAGGWHADLNAHNILVTPSGAFVVDLDRGRLVAPGARAQRRNLDRLERSLTGLGLLPAVEPGWRELLSAYRQPDAPA